MKIGIIGAGKIGGTLARLFTAAGHEVALSNSRGPDSLRSEVAALGARAQAMTVADAARWGELVVLAVPWRSPEALPPAETVRGKIVVDAMNPYRADGGVYDLGDSTASEETARRLPGARLVKAFNTLYFKHLASRGSQQLPADERQAIFVAGDDPEAKRAVERLIAEIGFAAVDTGSLREGGRRQQPGNALYNQPMSARQARELLSRSAA